MPANLPPDYHTAEERFRRAGSIEEKIECLQDMLRIMPKHKGTEKLQADLKSRMAKLRRQPRKKGVARDTSHTVSREGAGQIALVGPPNSGKSALVGALTYARPEVADYPFTTREVIPGMMAFEDIAFQLLDLPPLSEQSVEPWVFDLIRRADLLWLVVRATNSLDDLQCAVGLLASKGIRACPSGTEVAAAAGDHVVRQGLLVVSGVDVDGGPEDVEILKEFLEEPWPIIAVSAVEGTGLDALRRRTFEALEIVRVYTKQPGKPADRKRPFTFTARVTVEDVARTIHKEVLEKIKFAKIWGAGVYDGQTVQRDHLLADGDVVEIHT
jgi:ribosome-interacting GTPase 1